MGRIYHAWMDVKATFTGKDRRSILTACEFGEDQAQKAYDAALSSDAGMHADIRQLIMSQKDRLKMHHDLLEDLRDKN
ncbi:MAG: PA2169 family four-helix-bundle protein [Ferruginibacter sp.]